MEWMAADRQYERTWFARRHPDLATRRWPTSAPNSDSTARCRSTVAVSASWRATTASRPPISASPWWAWAVVHEGLLRSAASRRRMAGGQRRPRRSGPDASGGALRAAQRALAGRGEHLRTSGPCQGLEPPGGAGAALPARHRPGREPSRRPNHAEQAVRRRAPISGCARSGCLGVAGCECSRRWVSTPGYGKPTRVTPRS
jgi:hypothetical protein